MAFELDLNTRERERFAQQFEQLSKELLIAANAVRNLDDDMFVVHVSIFGLVGPDLMRELVPILNEGAEAVKLKKEMRNL